MMTNNMSLETSTLNPMEKQSMTAIATIDPSNQMENQSNPGVVTNPPPPQQQAVNKPYVNSDKEFRNLLPPKTPEQQKELEQMILRDGRCDPLVGWRTPKILLDGHHRHAICKEHNIPYEIRWLDFPNRVEAKMWMLQNQLARRNLNSFQQIETALKLKELFATKASANQRAGVSLISGKGIETGEEIAKLSGVSPDTVRKVERILERSGEVGVAEAIDALRRGDAGTSINSVYQKYSGGGKENTDLTPSAPKNQSKPKDKPAATPNDGTPKGTPNSNAAKADSVQSDWMESAKNTWWRIPMHGQRTRQDDISEAIADVIDSVQRAADVDALESLRKDLHNVQALVNAGGTELTAEKIDSVLTTMATLREVVAGLDDYCIDNLQTWSSIQKGDTNWTPFDDLPSYRKEKLTVREIIKAVTYILTQAGWKAEHITKTLITRTGINMMPGGNPLDKEVETHAHSCATTKWKERTIKGFREVQKWLQEYKRIDMSKPATGDECDSDDTSKDDTSQLGVAEEKATAMKVNPQGDGTFPKFWDALLRRMREQPNSPFKHSISRTKRNSTWCESNHHGFTYRFWLAPGETSCRVELWTRGDLRKLIHEHTDKLRQRKEVIESEFVAEGTKLEWSHAKEKNHHIDCTLLSVDVFKEGDWEKMIKFFIESTLRFEGVLE